MGQLSLPTYRKEIINPATAKAMMKPKPPPRGVGLVWELRSLGISSSVWLKCCSIAPVAKRLMKKLTKETTKIGIVNLEPIVDDWVNLEFFRNFRFTSSRKTTDDAVRRPVLINLSLTYRTSVGSDSDSQ
jgi:hypothetical protein